MKNYYEILGIDSSASINEIKAAYRKKAKEYHPDVAKIENAHQLFIEATEAYDFLMHAKTVTTQEKVTDSQNEAYEQWVNYVRQQTRERAQRFSKMRYDEFRKTKYYKATQTANEIYVYLSLGISVFIIVSAIYGFMDDLYDPKTKPAQYIGDVGIFILGLVFLFFSIFQTFDLAREKKEKL